MEDETGERVKGSRTRIVCVKLFGGKHMIQQRVKIAGVIDAEEIVLVWGVNLPLCWAYEK